MMETRSKNHTITRAHELHHRPFVFEDFSALRGRMGSGAANFSHTPHATSLAESLPVAEAAPAVAPEPPPPPAPPAISGEELEAARVEAEAAGYVRGFEAAKQQWDEAQAARETQISELLQVLTASFDKELEESRRSREALRSEVTNIVLMVARKMAGSALETQPLGAVEGIIGECLTMLAGEPRLSVSVAPEVKAPLEEYLQGFPQTDGQVVEVAADERMRAGDCRIQWPDGKAERQQENLWQEMEKIITRSFSAKKG